MGDGLHLSLVQGEGGLQEGLAVARGAGPGDSGGAGKHGFQIPDGGLGRLDGISLVVGVEGIQQLPFLADEGQLGGCGAGIDAQVAVAAIGFQIGLFHHGLAVPLAEGLIIRLVPEKRRKPGHLERDPDTLFQPRNKLSQSHGLGIPAFQGGTHGSKQMGILRVHDLIRG